MNRSVKLAILQKVVPPYRVSVFDAISKRFDSKVFHSRKRSGSNFTLAADLPFPNERLKAFYYRSGDTSLVQNLLPLLRFRPSVIISEFALSYLSFWILFLLRPFMSYKLVVWTHGIKANELQNPFRSLPARLRRFIYERSDALLTYSAGRQDVLRENLSNPDKVFLARNTLDTKALDLIHRQLESVGRERVKKELGFSYSFNVVYIGRLRPEKGVAFLLEEFRYISKHADVELHIIGNGEDEVIVAEALAEGLPIRFHGPVYNEVEAGRILYACDLLLNPGMVGLSMVHGFSFALPCITLQMKDGWPQHSPEIEFLKDGVNGMFCQSESYSDQVLALLQDQARLEAMKASALYTARHECTLETMIDGFAECIHYVTSK